VDRGARNEVQRCEGIVGVRFSGVRRLPSTGGVRRNIRPADVSAAERRVEARASRNDRFVLPPRATVTPSGACMSSAAVDYLWPAGYRVRLHPTVLLDPTGKVVAHQGQYITAGGGVVGTASWPSAARCYKGGQVWAIQGPIQVGRPGLAP
jgi:hypothetical protein